jgi:hypothetical protein
MWFAFWPGKEAYGFGVDNSKNKTHHHHFFRTLKKISKIFA